jgi:ribosome-binding factor A
MAKILSKSQRQLQIGENIKRNMADIFIRKGLSNIAGSLISIVEADVSPDMKNVKIYIDIFGGEKKIHQKIIKDLNLAVGNFRYELAKRLSLRSVPEILFLIDETQDRALKIAELINDEQKKYNKT